MPNNEQDALPLGADAASLAGSIASSMFGGRVDNRLKALRRQQNDITNFLNAWVIQNGRIRYMDIKSRTPEGLHNLTLAE